MSFCKTSAIVEASPDTIWNACFAPMRCVPLPDLLPRIAHLICCSA